MFEFLDPGELVDGDLRLVLERTLPEEPFTGRVPEYRFAMLHSHTGARMGSIGLRVGHTERIDLYAGNIGYGVDEPYRGSHLAERASRLLLPLARRHGLTTIWITCNPDNLPSRRTCERLGATMVDIVHLPPGTDMYERGERQKCRYRLDLT